MEEALTDIPLFREFAGIDIGQDVVPDESTILRFRHLLEAHGMMFDSATRGNAEKGLADTVVGTSANVNDVTQAHALLHGEETRVFAVAGCRGVDKGEEVQRQHPSVRWHVAMMPGKCRALPETPRGVAMDSLEQVKARIARQVPCTGQEHGQLDDALCTVLWAPRGPLGQATAPDDA